MQVIYNRNYRGLVVFMVRSATRLMGWIILPARDCDGAAEGSILGLPVTSRSWTRVLVR